MIHLGEKTWWFYPNLLSLQGFLRWDGNFSRIFVRKNLRKPEVGMHSHLLLAQKRQNVHASIGCLVDFSPFVAELLEPEAVFDGRFWRRDAKISRKGSLKCVRKVRNQRTFKGSKGESEQCLTKRVMAGKWMRKGTIPELSKSHQIHLNQELRLTVHS